MQWNENGYKYILFQLFIAWQTNEKCLGTRVRRIQNTPVLGEIPIKHDERVNEEIVSESMAVHWVELLQLLHLPLEHKQIDSDVCELRAAGERHFTQSDGSTCSVRRKNEYSIIMCRSGRALNALPSLHSYFFVNALHVRNVKTQII